MVVDDVDMNLKVLSALLSSLNFKSFCFSDAKKAFDEINEIKPDIILTDLWMPKVSGLDFAKMIKSNPITNNIPVIVVTADVTANNEIFDDVLLKPITISNLSKVFQKFTNGNLTVRKI